MADKDLHTTPDPGSPEWRAERLHRFSHGLRNKLSGLYEAMRMLQERGDDPERNDIAAFAEIQFFQALRDVEVLLDEFGVERGVGAVKKADLDLAALVEAAIGHSQHRLEKKGQQVRRSIAPGLRANADRYYLEEALAALVSNASKFSAVGATIHISAHTAGDHVVLDVRDEGVGLPAEDLPNVFKRFAWLGSRSTAGEAQGRGTLARVKSWIDAHGGTIAVQSEGPGKGCTFTIRIPAAAIG